MKPEYQLMLLAVIAAISAIVSNVLKIKLDVRNLSQQQKNSIKRKPYYNRIFTYSSAILLWVYLTLSSAPVSKAFIVSVNVVTALFVVSVMLDIVERFLYICSVDSTDSATA